MDPSAGHPLSHPVPEETEGINQPSGKHWVQFDAGANDANLHNQKNETTSENSDAISTNHQTSATSQSNQSHENVAAVIQPSSSVQVCLDPLSESLSPNFQVSSPIAASSGSGSNSSKSFHNQANNLKDSSDISAQTSFPLTQDFVKRPNSLPNIGKSFRNGQILVTLLPLNTSCAWLTAARFRAELVPEELMHPSLSLTVEEYVQAMNILIHDHRFTLYNIMYKRIVFFWITLGFLLLISLLFSGARGLSLFAGGTLWLIMNAIGIFACMWFKFRLTQSLERCLQSVNAIFMKHNLLLGVDDRGHLSCHKINLFFIYFDTSHCCKFLNQMIDKSNTNGSSIGAQNASTSCYQATDITRIEIEDDVVIITSASDAKKNRKADRRLHQADRLIQRYSQRWVKEFVRKRLDLKIRFHYQSAAANADNTWTELPPRHCIGSRCPCQFIEEHLKFKPMSRISFRDLCL